MTNTTSLHALVENRRTFVSPAMAQPGLLTFLSQGALGWAFGVYVWFVGYMLVYVDPNSFFFGIGIPLLLTMGTVIGSPVGFMLWLFTKLSDRPLSRTFRATIALLLLAIGGFALLLRNGGEPPTGERQLGAVLVIVVPGIMIGLFAGSNLRAGRELVRVGDAKLMLSKIFAILTGLVLRFSVVQLFFASMIAAIATFQAFFFEKPYPEQLDPKWIAAAFAHFALGMIVLFARVRFEVQAVLTAIASVPVIASFWMIPEMPVELRYVLIGYLVAWALFLLSRWRKTDVAVAVLNDELRYYLID